MEFEEFGEGWSWKEPSLQDCNDVMMIHKEQYGVLEEVEMESFRRIFPSWGTALT